MAFSRNFTTNLTSQCSAFSRTLKIEKLKTPLFSCPEGAGDSLQMTGALQKVIVFSAFPGTNIVIRGVS